MDHIFPEDVIDGMDFLAVVRLEGYDRCPSGPFTCPLGVRLVYSVTEDLIGHPGASWLIIQDDSGWIPAVIHFAGTVHPRLLLGGKVEHAGDVVICGRQDAFGWGDENRIWQLDDDGDTPGWPSC